MNEYDLFTSQYRFFFILRVVYFCLTRREVGLVFYLYFCFKTLKKLYYSSVLYLSFLVESFLVAVWDAETPWVQHVCDFKAVKDALHFPPARALHQNHSFISVKQTQEQRVPTAAKLFCVVKCA